MRVVYGAGAVAVASVMAVGLVQPDFTATADQQPTDDPNAAVANAPGASNGARSDNSQTGNGSNDQSSSDAQTTVQVKHVIKYIHLKPGQSAPPGATVIQPGQPTPKIIVANKPGPAPTQPPSHNNPPPANNNPPPANNNPPPANNPPPVHQPPPTPKPTIKTHQSGRP